MAKLLTIQARSIEGGGLKKNWYGNQQNKQYKGSLSRSASYGIMKYVTGVSFNV